MTDSDQNRGLYNKYRVERVDGKQRGPYFVLDYQNDPYAAIAVFAYADVVEREYPLLARDLRQAVRAARSTTSGRPSFLTTNE